ncbi:unnamed protein product [Urochloa decumbens]|uniref:Uncharacterized protein n=2 Tax=Urochloa decumbens TaxID=240449 RepID=A0ABC9BFJ2_9POAL
MNRALRFAHIGQKDMDENSANDQCSYRTSMNTSEPSKSATSDSAYSPPSMLKGCSKYNTQFSLAKMTKLIDTLTKPQKDIVRDCGFGSILALKCSSIPNNVILWLAKQYDSKSRAVKLDGGRSFRIDAITAHQILGVPFGGSKSLSSPPSKPKLLYYRTLTSQT